MISVRLRNYWLVASLVIGLGAASIGARAQTIQFPGGGTNPVIAAPTVTQVNSDGLPALIMDAGSGHAFVPEYDSGGHLASLTSTTGSNAFNLRAVTYTTDGHLMSVSFGNRYQMFFQYRNDGTQAIRDSLGNAVVRSKTGDGPYVTQSANDEAGILVPSLQRLKTLFLLFGPVPDL